MQTKGYPDLNSWMFLQHLTKLSNDLPLFSCTDSDPDGLAIHHCYVQPPKSLAGSKQNHVELPITRLGVDLRDNLADSTIVDKCITLTNRDRKRARTMLGQGISDLKSKSSLQTMLMLNLKMEIQAIDIVPWLNNAMIDSH